MIKFFFKKENINIFKQLAEAQHFSIMIIMSVYLIATHISFSDNFDFIKFSTFILQYVSMSVILSLLSFYYFFPPFLIGGIISVILIHKNKKNLFLWVFIAFILGSSWGYFLDGDFFRSAIMCSPMIGYLMWKKIIKSDQNLEIKNA